MSRAGAGIWAAGIWAAGLLAAASIGAASVRAQAAGAPRAEPADVPLGHPDFRPTPDRPVGWRGDWTGRYPGADPVTAWDIEKGINVLWRLPTKEFGCATPVVAGDRLFVTMEPRWLISLDKMTGRILWAADGRQDAVRDADRLRELIVDEPHAKTPPEDPRAKAPPEEAGAKTPADAPGAKAPAEGERVRWSDRRLAYGNYAGHTMPTPVTDGRHVWVKFGGFAACFDLDGNRVWAAETHLAGTDHPMNVPSPMLAEGVLICEGGISPWWEQNSTRKLADGVLPPNKNPKFRHWMVGLDAATGRALWDLGPLNAGGYGGVSSPMPLVRTVAGERRTFVVTGEGQVLRPRDGRLLAPYVGARCGTPSPYLIGDRVMFNHVFSLALVDVRIASPDAAEARVLWSTPSAKVTCGSVSSDGLIYIHTLEAPKGQTAWVNVHDAADGRCVYRGRLPFEVPPDSADYPCPAVAGKYVFVFTTRTAAAIEPGRTPRCVASSRQERMHACPTFDGDRMYLRTFDAAVCIARTGDEGARYERQVRAGMPPMPPPEPPGPPPAAPGP